jgi:hypothetical protein
MTDSAQKVSKYVLESGVDVYATFKEILIDSFHGDETAEKYLKNVRKLVEVKERKCVILQFV